MQGCRRGGAGVKSRQLTEPSGMVPYTSVTMPGAEKAPPASRPQTPQPACTAMASRGSSICNNGGRCTKHQRCEVGLGQMIS